jgi:hypothetical protein
MVKAQLPSPSAETLANPHAVVLPYSSASRRRAPAKAAMAKATMKMSRSRQSVAAAR